MCLDCIYKSFCDNDSHLKNGCKHNNHALFTTKEDKELCDMMCGVKSAYEIGDTVKIIKCDNYDVTDVERNEWVGKIGKITDIHVFENNIVAYEVCNMWWWLDYELQKGKLVFVADED